MDSVPFSEPEPISDHRCFGPGCPGCKSRARSSMISHPDSTHAPNHYHMGTGYPRCRTTRFRSSTLQTRQTLHKYGNSKRRPASSMSVHMCAFQSTSSCEESPRFSGSSQFSNPDGPVRLSPHSEPEPPHECRVIPCNVCGKTW